MCIRSSVQATAMGKWLDVRSEAVIRPGGGPAVRAALFANVSSPVSAVLLLGFFPSSFSLIVFFFSSFLPKLPRAKSRKRPAFAYHHTPLLLCGLSPFLCLTPNLALIRAGVPSLSPPFTPTLTCGPLWFFALKLRQQNPRGSFFRILFIFRTN